MYILSRGRRWIVGATIAVLPLCSLAAPASAAKSSSCESPLTVSAIYVASDILKSLAFVELLQIQPQTEAYRFAVSLFKGDLELGERLLVQIAAGSDSQQAELPFEQSGVGSALLSLLGSSLPADDNLIAALPDALRTRLDASGQALFLAVYRGRLLSAVSRF